MTDHTPLDDVLWQVTDPADGSTRTVEPSANASSDPWPGRDDSDHTTTYRTLDGSTVEVEAWRGTQLISTVTGDPINATQFGRVHLHITDIDLDEVIIEFIDPDDISSVIDALSRARVVATSRNPANDAPRN